MKCTIDRTNGMDRVSKWKKVCVCVCAYVKNTSVQDKYAVVCDYCEINGAVRQHKKIIAEIKAWKMARERLEGK